MLERNDNRKRKGTIIALLMLALTIGGGSLLRADQEEQVVKIEKIEKTTGRGYLGVAVTMTKGDEEKGDGQQVVVQEVAPGKPAGKAGIKVGDVILAIDGQKIERPGDLQEVVAGKAPGSKVKIALLREQKPLHLTVVLGDAPEKGLRRIVERRVQNPRAMFLGDEESGYLGVQSISLTKDLGEYFGVPDGAGALVTEVEKESPAEKAGMKGGDVILTVDGKKVTGTEKLRRLIRRNDAGEEVTLGIRRRDQDLTLKVELGKVPPGGEEEEFNWLARPPAAPGTPQMLRFHFDGSDLEGLSERLRGELAPLKEMAVKIRKIRDRTSM